MSEVAKAHSFEQRESEVRKLRRIASTLDSAIKRPGGYRIGLDGLIGLVPVVGDGVSACISTFIVYRAGQLGVSTAQLLRMMLNILFETLVGFVPLVGDVFDFMWKANEKNMAILESHLPKHMPERSAAGRASRAATIVVVGSFIALLTLVTAFAYLAYALLALLF